MFTTCFKNYGRENTCKPVPNQRARQWLVGAVQKKRRSENVNKRRMINLVHFVDEGASHVSHVSRVPEQLHMTDSSITITSELVPS